MTVPFASLHIGLQRDDYTETRVFTLFPSTSFVSNIGPILDELQDIANENSLGFVLVPLFRALSDNKSSYFSRPVRSVHFTGLSQGYFRTINHHLCFTKYRTTICRSRVLAAISDQDLMNRSNAVQFNRQQEQNHG
jgi:retron-type reverse transcriptase